MKKFHLLATILNAAKALCSNMIKAPGLCGPGCDEKKVKPRGKCPFEGQGKDACPGYKEK